MRPKLFWAVASGVSCALFFAVGCGSSSAHVRVLNAIPIQSSIDMLIDSKNVASSIPYGAASGYVTVSSGSRHLQIEPSGSTPFVDQTISLSSGSYDTILDMTSGATVLTDDNSAPASGDVKVRVVNASSNLGAADIYVVTSSTGLGASPTFSSLGVSVASGYDSVAAGSYQVYFVTPGTSNVILNTNALSFSSGQVRTVVVLDGETGGITTSQLADLN
ncbi:MAG TPA: DUF4397 domain-containing protein [Terriglobales bacterium]|nr:DUF4397 domain-containing protein [Terriglobales bacterium]